MSDRSSLLGAVFDRRSFLGVLAAISASPAAAVPRTLGSSGSGQLNAVFDAIMAESLQASPELATNYGLDKGADARLKRQLDDRSLAAAQAERARLHDQIARLDAVDRLGLSALDLINLDAVRLTFAARNEVGRHFDYGAATVAQPYVLSHLTGAYSSVPELLGTKHDVTSESDADAYLSRLDQLGPVLLQEVQRMLHDAGLGVTPPDFVQDLTLRQLRALRAQRAAETEMVAGLNRKVDAARLPRRYVDAAAEIVATSVMPAIDAQIAAVEKLRPSATHDAGVWRLPDGERYYAASLGIEVTTAQTPAELHRLGLALTERLGAQLFALLKAQGYGGDTLAARTMALLVDQKYIYADTEAGKAALISEISGKLDEIRARLPRIFHALPSAKVQIRRVPAFLEAGAPFASYEDPSIDGSRPGIFYINLRNTADTPSWMFTTTAFHEALPGHHLQQVVLQEGPPMPTIRKVIWSSGYGEGWGLYAEQLADELGMYDQDPTGRIGYVLSALLRASRLVVDTGIHSLRWTREEAITWLIERGGIPKALATNEVERYCIWPGQACSYMVGKQAWLDQRTRAQKTLGARFDIRDFHQATLAVGAVPLTLLDGVVSAYIARASAGGHS